MRPHFSSRSVIPAREQLLLRPLQDGREVSSYCKFMLTSWDRVLRFPHRPTRIGFCERTAITDATSPVLRVPRPLSNMKVLVGQAGWLWCR